MSSHVRVVTLKESVMRYIATIFILESYTVGGDMFLRAYYNAQNLSVDDEMG